MLVIMIESLDYIPDPESPEEEAEQVDPYSYEHRQHLLGEAEDTEVFFARILEYQPYAPEALDEMMSTGEYTLLEAIAILSTEMDGAGEGEGGVSARQTACTWLGYAESVPETEGQAHGRETQYQQLRYFFNLPDEFEMSDDQADMLVDAWMKAAERALGKEQENRTEKWLRELLDIFKEEKPEAPELLELLRVYTQVLGAEKQQQAIMRIRKGEEDSIVFIEMIKALLDNPDLLKSI